MNIIQNIFSIKNDGNHKILTILGVKIKILRTSKLLEQEIKNYIESKFAFSQHFIINRLTKIIKNETKSAIMVFNQHQKIFPEYQNRHKNKDIVLVATGPSLRYYTQIHNSINIGVNRAYQNNNIKFDYLFFLDYRATREYIMETQDYNCTKFVGWHSNPDFNPWDVKRKDSCHIPDSIVKNLNAKIFYVNTFDDYISKDISTSPLIDFGSSVFPAFHFSLFTLPKRIFLVGCDCTFNGYFDGTEQNLKDKFLMDETLKGYNKVKQFINNFYQNTEIISINPIGLKGVFKDVYTESFLNTNPDIKEELGNNYILLEDYLNNTK